MTVAACLGFYFSVDNKLIAFTGIAAFITMIVTMRSHTVETVHAIDAIKEQLEEQQDD